VLPAGRDNDTRPALCYVAYSVMLLHNRWKRGYRTHSGMDGQSTCVVGICPGFARGSIHRT